MDQPPPRSTVRRFAAALAGACFLAIGAAVIAMTGAATSDPSEVIGADAETDIEVCDATEYEGCPARWEYLWADAED